MATTLQIPLQLKPADSISENKNSLLYTPTDDVIPPSPFDYLSQQEAIQQLDSIIVSYTDHSHENQYRKPVTTQTSNRLKTVMIEQAISANIKKIKFKNNESMESILKNYAFHMLNEAHPQLDNNDHRDDILNYFKSNKLNPQKLSQIKRRDFTKAIAAECCKHGKVQNSYKEFNDLYAMIGQYAEYTQLITKLHENQKKLCCSSNCNNEALQPLRITYRRVETDKIKIGGSHVTHEQKQKELRTTRTTQLINEEELNTAKTTMYIHGKGDDNMQFLEIPTTSRYISYDDSGLWSLREGDRLSEINGKNVIGLAVSDVIKLIEYEPLPFTMTFRRKKLRCCTCWKSTETKKKKKSVLRSVMKFTKLTFGIVIKSSSMLDAITDVILLYKSANNGAIMFTMLLFITILSPYILSYSSGVHVFLHRRTFSNVELFTFKSLLLLFYLFPTGILYFIVLDVVDVIMELYKWIGFGCLNKIKSSEELIQIEAGVADYFGMSRMDYHSFKKQKLIAQLFFETIPQVTLQALLFSGVITNDLGDITDKDILISLSAASFNFFVQIFRLKKESQVTKETFIQYSLHCITSRFAWVPFLHLLEQQIKSGSTKPLKPINYTMKYKIGVITRLSEYMLQRDSKKPLQIADLYDDYFDSTASVRGKFPHMSYSSLHDAEFIKTVEKLSTTTTKKTARGSIEYDFSNITINKLITIIKSIPERKTKVKPIIIRFGESLRLLNVRTIMQLMQACSEKHIELPDIDAIDWNQPFNNTDNNEDIRLFSNTFDADKKSLLISLYLSGYGTQNGYKLLKEFVSNFDVSINIKDNKGDSIFHHMIRQKDYDGVYLLFDILKPNQRIHFEQQNDAGDTIFHEMVKDINNYEELKHMINEVRLRSNHELNLNVFNDAGESLLYLALEQFKKQITDDVGHVSAENKDEYEDKENEKNNDKDKEKKKIIGLIINCSDEDEVVDIKDETVINAMHFLIYRIDNDPKKHGKIITRKHEKYTTMKQKIKTYKTARPVQKPKRRPPAKNVKIAAGLLVEYDENIVRCIVHEESKRSALGHVLQIDYVNAVGLDLHQIIDILLQKNALLLPPETISLYRLFQYVIHNKQIDKFYYLNLLNKIMIKCNVSVIAICDANGNNPLHYLVKDADLIQSNQRIIPYFCELYPDWCSMQNKEGQIPLLLSVEKLNIDIFFALCRYMSTHGVDVKLYLRKKQSVQKMIAFAMYLLDNINARNKLILKLLFATFDYSELFRYSSRANKFNASLYSGDISLIKEISINFQTIQKNIKILEECGLKTNNIKTEKVDYDDDDERASGIHALPDSLRLQLSDALTDSVKPKQQKEYEEKKEKEKDEPIDEADTLLKLTLDTIHESSNRTNSADDNTNMILAGLVKETESKSFDWIELVYSTIVETFSAGDLYTDIIILVQLFQSRNLWWAVWMLLLLVSPYLVAHGTLVVILQKKLSFNQNEQNSISSVIISFFESLLMTPIALVYLVVIDCVFMIFSLFSTFWILLVIFCFIICCKKLNEATKFDIRGWIDQKIFVGVLKMNRTEITGYRRLRTMSQLFFETIPQIVLQGRILWVIEYKGDSNNEFTINKQTVAISVILAIAHLLLEGGIIYLDSKAFRMSWQEYSLECLGGRVSWIPYMHLIKNIIENQFYIYRFGEINKINIDSFDVNSAKSFVIYVSKNENNNNDEEKQKLLTLDYEKITAQMQCTGIQEYSTSYQFSPQSMNAFTEILMSCPEMTVPQEFNFSSNIPLQNLMKQVLRKSVIKLGPHSFGNVDINSLCKLYQASFNKIRMNLNDIDGETVKRLITNMKNNNNLNAEQIIRRSLVNFGKINCLQWILDAGLAKDLMISETKLEILQNSLKTKPFIVRLDILRKCYIDNFYVGSNCQTMGKIMPIINACHARCKQDKSWYFVIIFILLYTKGNIFGEHCSNKCCVINEKLKKDLLKDFIPSWIEINTFKIPFILFECMKCFRKLYRDHVEEIFLNKCKNFIMSSNKMENKRHVEIKLATDISQIFNDWQIFDENMDNEIYQKRIETLLHQLHTKKKNHITNWNAQFLYRIILESNIDLRCNHYINESFFLRVGCKSKKTQYSSDESLGLHKLYIKDLVPRFKLSHKKNKKRFQICKLSITLASDIEEKYEEHDVSTYIKSICFNRNIKHNYKDLNANIIYFYNNEQEKKTELTIDSSSNVGLSYYNYHLLYPAYEDETGVPMIRIQLSSQAKINVNVSYLSTIDHQTLVEAKSIEHQTTVQTNTNTHSDQMLVEAKSIEIQTTIQSFDSKQVTGNTNTTSDQLILEDVYNKTIEETESHSNNIRIKIDGIGMNDEKEISDKGLEINVSSLNADGKITPFGLQEPKHPIHNMSSSCMMID